jgi:hypothetical protein
MPRLGLVAEEHVLWGFVITMEIRPYESHVS